MLADSHPTKQPHLVCRKSMPPPPNHVINAALVTDQFGGWPSFHDAEIISVVLSRNLPGQPICEMVIHAWNMTREVDARGYFILDRHALVTLRFEGLFDSELRGFNRQNCLFDMLFKEELFQNESVLRVDLSTSFGLEGLIRCARVVVVNVQPCTAEGQPPATGSTPEA